MLIPLMLPELMPLIPWPTEDTLEFTYQYDVMPAGLVPAFMARMHRELSKTSPPWRHGCVLELKQCAVRVIGDAESKRVLISVSGTEVLRREALDQVRFTFESLHAAVENLPVEQLIPVPHHPEAPMLDYEFVRSLDWEGTTEFKTKGTAFGQTITVNVREALDGVRGKERKQRDEEQHAAIVHNHHYPPGTNPKFMNDDNSITARDIIKSQVGQTLTNCINSIQQMPSGEPKDLLEKLVSQLAPMRRKMIVEDAEVLDQHMAKLTEEAQKPKAEVNTSELAVTGKGLIEAAQTVGEIAAPVLTTVGLILKFFGVSLPS